MADKKDPDFRNAFATSAKAQKEARERLKAGIEQRAKSSILISPDEVGGDYDTSRALTTTLGGQGHRPITQDDLKTFQATVRQLGKKFKGGITAKQVIDLSMPGPRARAHAEIKTAMPITYRGGRVQFQTNAGPHSKHQRHMVTVELLNYEACVASPIPPSKIVGELLKGKIKIECNCEDWRYRLRYVATTGRYAAGPWFENAMPKITNPMLLGVACKHVIRVMALLVQSPTFKGYAVRMIETGRTAVERKNQNTNIKDMEKFKDDAKSEAWRQRAIKTTEEKRAARAGMTVGAYRLQQSALARMTPKVKQKAKAKAAAKPQSDAMIIKNMMANMGWSETQAKAALAAAKTAI